MLCYVALWCGSFLCVALWCGAYVALCGVVVKRTLKFLLSLDSLGSLDGF